jgi:uncharacterized membrane protein
MTTPPPVALTKRLEETAALDRVVRVVRPWADALVASPLRRNLLRGSWLGHALHPALTDVPIGFWASATVLDLVGGSDARPAARRLVGLGILAAGPTALTGWAEWSDIGEREQRVGVLHAASNVAALSLYTASWVARRGGQHRRGTTLALAATGVLGLGGYLGGHLVSARKVGSLDPAFADGPHDRRDGVPPDGQSLLASTPDS